MHTYVNNNNIICEFTNYAYNRIHVQLCDIHAKYKVPQKKKKKYKDIHNDPTLPTHVLT